MQLVPPVVAWKSPAAQLKQAVFDGEAALYCPVKQAVQETRPEAPW